jgi:hypothetical protein
MRKRRVFVNTMEMIHALAETEHDLNVHIWD